MMTDVCLVLMPYAAMERPSLALGLLKASLKQNGIEPAVLYPNLWFAEDIGIYKYKVISEAMAAGFVGEWTFSGVVFPEFEPDHAEYFKTIACDKADTIRELWSVRNQADAFINKVAQSVLDLQPRIVACSSTFHQHCPSLALLRRIRELEPEIITVMGGSNCEGLMGVATHQAFPWVDFVCSGEGDELFATLCRKLLDQGRDLDLTKLPYGVIGSHHRGQELIARDCFQSSLSDLDPPKSPLKSAQILGVALLPQNFEQDRGTNSKFSPLRRGDAPVPALSWGGSPDLKIIPSMAPRASVENLDKIAIPDFDDYFQTLQTCPKIAPYITPGLFVETSRGCWWGQKQHCTFCGLNGSGMTYRSKSPERVVQEFTWLAQRYGLRKFFVVDNILDLNHIDTVLPMFAALKEPYSIFYETKANLKRHQVQQLAEAGVLWLQPGIESMHDSLLGLMKKGNTALINVQLLKWAREFGIQVFWNFLVGLPGENRNWYSEMLEWLPLIVHLQPPSEQTRMMRFDRFSPYYEKAADYGLTLVPQKAYSYIYPLSPEFLQHLAYHFEEVGEDRRLPEHEKLKGWVNEWQMLFKSESAPSLSVSVNNGDRLLLIDTRPCAIEREISLEGLAYQVYVECDRVLSYQELVNALSRKFGRDVSWDEIQQIVEQLRERKVLLEINGKLLSLAVKEPLVPLLDMKEQPGGFVDVRGYVSDIRKKFWELFKNKALT